MNWWFLSTVWQVQPSKAGYCHLLQVLWWNYEVFHRLIMTIWDSHGNEVAMKQIHIIECNTHCLYNHRKWNFVNKYRFPICNAIVWIIPELHRVIMNSMKLVVPLHSLLWSIHTNGESKRGTTPSQNMNDFHTFVKSSQTFANIKTLYNSLPWAFVWCLWIQF